MYTQEPMTWAPVYTVHYNYFSGYNDVLILARGHVLFDP